MQGGQQGCDSGRSSSPRAARKDNLSKISLLGQQVFGSEQQKQQQSFQQQNTGSMSFSLGVQSQARSFSQQGHQQKQASQPAGGNVSVDGGEFPSLQGVNSLGSGFGQSQVFLNQPVLQSSGADFLKPVQALGLFAGGAAGVSQESLMGALSAIQQNISHLQSMLPYMNHSQQVPNALVQQQAAAAISQIARVAANMFPQNALQNPPPHLSGQPQQQQQQQQLGPLMPTPIQQQPPNFYPHCGPAGGGSDPVMGNNSFTSALQVMDGEQGGTVGAQIGDRGVGGHPPPNPSEGSGIPTRSTSPAGGAQGVGNGPPQLGNNVTSGQGSRGKHGTASSGEQVAKGGDPCQQHASNRPSPMDDDATGGDIGGPREDDDDGEQEVLAPGSYDLVEMDAVEILAEHTHFCGICGKGFKRDANLRMHMRGHGDEYKTPAALARPDKAAHLVAAVVRQRRFSCPYVGCKRNKKHRKFQPLKTMLCVKNHYRRSHCPKILTCNKCKAKKFSVVADLKTHEKHCGCDKWQCSCGTTFSRKDKLFGHIGLFAGHTPAISFADADGSGELDVSDLGASGGNPPALSGDTAASGYGSITSGLGGGNGMGLGAGGQQGLASRGGGGFPGGNGGGGLTMPKDGNVLGPETSSSSDSFPSPGNLLPGYLSGSLFNANYMQSGGGGGSSPDRLR